MEESQDQTLQGRIVDKIEPEMLKSFSLREARALVEFLESSTCPAVIVAAVDTVPNENGENAIFSSALGSKGVIMNLLLWLQAEVISKMGGDGEEQRPN